MHLQSGGFEGFAYVIPVNIWLSAYLESASKIKEEAVMYSYKLGINRFYRSSGDGSAGINAFSGPFSCATQFHPNSRMLHGSMILRDTEMQKSISFGKLTELLDWK